MAENVPNQTGADRSTADSEAERQEYLAGCAKADQMMAESAKSYDTAILTLSSGSLGLSIAFIEKIAPRLCSKIPQNRPHFGATT